MDLNGLLAANEGLLADTIGIEFPDGGENGAGFLRAQLVLERKHFAGNGFVHAGAVVTLADTACGYGCVLNLPDDAYAFTTLELKSNFLRTVTEGTIVCDARLLHGGRTTQIWDAEVRTPDGKPMALFRCTQLILRA